MTNEEAIRILDPATTREALAEIEYYGGFNGHEAVMKAVEDACVMGAEALSQERPKGRWIFYNRVNYVDECHCSLCEQVLSTYKGERKNFCPNCGADMREIENE